MCAAAAAASIYAVLSPLHGPRHNPSWKGDLYLYLSTYVRQKKRLARQGKKRHRLWLAMLMNRSTQGFSRKGVGGLKILHIQNLNCKHGPSPFSATDFGRAPFH